MPSKERIGLYASGFLILAFMVQTGLAPLYKIRDLKLAAANDSTRLRDYPDAFTEETGLLARELAYREALLQLAQSDSIGLVVNLKDSLLVLTIKGVPIHATIIGEYRIDPFLRELPERLYLPEFSKPIRMIDEYSTIVKEPVVIREAPKDPVEASLNAWKPDTLIQNPAFLKIKLTGGYTLFLEQDHNPTFRDKWTQFHFRTGERITAFGANLMRFFSFRKPEYLPSVRVRIPQDGLRAIYRALPAHAEVVIYAVP